MSMFDWIENLVGMIMHWEKRLDEATTPEEKKQAEENLSTLKAVHARATHGTKKQEGDNENV